MFKAKRDKTIGGKGVQQSLSHEQRKELMSLMKRILPPVPSLGIIDIRFSFWFLRHWYVVFIFGRDTRKQFRSLDKGDMDTALTTVAKVVTYIILVLIAVILLLYALYLIKSLLGIDLYPDTHLRNIISDKLRGGQ